MAEPDAHEVCFLIGQDHAVIWNDASASAFALPDSRTRWITIWERRAELTEIAHSHPFGPLGFSEEDRTTMIALRSALGRDMRFSVVAPNGMMADEGGRQFFVDPEPPWAAELRKASGMTAKP
jgi:hypothetical protein